jgi:hypothetical protein
MGRDRTRRPLVLAADAGVGVQRATAELAEHAGEELALVEGLLEMQHPPAAAAGPARRTPRSSTGAHHRRTAVRQRWSAVTKREGRAAPAGGGMGQRPHGGR